MAPGKHGVINKEFVGKTPAAILKTIGMSVHPDTRLVIAEVDRAASPGVDRATHARHAPWCEWA